MPASSFLGISNCLTHDDDDDDNDDDDEMFRGPRPQACRQHRLTSSAVATRPHDASCLSVVSLNSTKRRALSSIMSR